MSRFKNSHKCMLLGFVCFAAHTRMLYALLCVEWQRERESFEGCIFYKNTQSETSRFFKKFLTFMFAFSIITECEVMMQIFD